MKEILKQKAEEIGFIAIGFARPSRPLYFNWFESWLSEGRNAGMSWMNRYRSIREDPKGLLEGCRTVISLAYPYPFQKPSTEDGYTVSRYSNPEKKDYHGLLKDLCKGLISIIKEEFNKSRSRVCVDSAPILERSYAISAGLGFFGKNNMLIIPGYGSYFYLAEILTTVPIEFHAPNIMDTECGECRRCIDACPTGALDGPFSFDASRCLSYLSIEYKGDIDKETGKRMGRCFFGCDRCQEVCPFNKEQEGENICLPSTDEIMNMEEDIFRERYGNTALARRGLEKIQSNIRTIKC